LRDRGRQDPEAGTISPDVNDSPSAALVLGLGISLAVVAPVHAWADPVGVCPGKLGSPTSFLRLPVVMVGERVRFVQDPRNRYFWDVRADYLFENETTASISTPMLFPARFDPGIACDEMIEGFSVRVGGKAAPSCSEACGGLSACRGSEGEGARETLRCAELCSVMTPDYCPGVGPAPTDALHRYASCELGATCFEAEFPARARTEMSVAYRYNGCPSFYHSDICSDPSVYGVVHTKVAGAHEGSPMVSWREGSGGRSGSYGETIDLEFVLETGAYWEGSIGEVHMSFAMVDLPWNLRVCYGSRCSSFARSATAKLGRLTATISDDGVHTEVMLTGKGIEPDANVKVSYDRSFFDLLAMMEAVCGVDQRLLLLSPDADPAEVLRRPLSEEERSVCAHLPHHYLGYRLEERRIAAKIRALFHRRFIYEEELSYVGDEEGAEDGWRQTLRKVPLSPPSRRYKLPGALTFEQQTIRERGLSQLDKASRLSRFLLDSKR
jgi:hypothetical protein